MNYSAAILLDPMVKIHSGRNGARGHEKWPCFRREFSLQSSRFLRYKAMDTLVFEAQKRSSTDRMGQLRRDKQIPAVFYGTGIEAMSLTLDYTTFRRFYKQVKDRSIFDLKIDGGKPFKAMVHEVQFHPVSGELSHIDFLNISMDRKITTKIAVETTGVSLAVKDFAGVVMVSRPMIEIRCLPGDLIHKIVVDVSCLKTFHDSIHVRDLKVPATIQILEDPDTTVVTVLPPRKEEEETPVAAAAATTEAAAGAAPAAGAAAGTPAAGAAPAAKAPAKK